MLIKGQRVANGNSNTIPVLFQRVWDLIGNNSKVNNLFFV